MSDKTFEMSRTLSNHFEYYSDRWNPDRLARIYKQLSELTEELIKGAPEEYKEDYIKLRNLWKHRFSKIYKGTKY